LNLKAQSKITAGGGVW